MLIKQKSLSGNRVLVSTENEFFYILVEDKRSKVTVDGNPCKNAEQLLRDLGWGEYTAQLTRDPKVMGEVLKATFTKVQHEV